MRVVIHGTPYEITRELVEQRPRGATPEAGMIHFVVEGREFPVKQALRAALSPANEDFTSRHARSILRRLGFELRVR